ncbi:MAG: hypothetical protein CL596_05150 [Alteromonas sp.]|nr:hypothetical protein [Alteromonas sp.]|tara:strand:- start:21 stop:341 length:321 start_codon:yes stop_codon:yes gene_type:complete
MVIHDANYIDRKEFLSMGYNHNIMFLFIFYNNEILNKKPFNLGPELNRDWLYSKEFEDRIDNLVKRGYIKKVFKPFKNQSYKLYSITPYGLKQAENGLKNKISTTA